MVQISNLFPKCRFAVVLCLTSGMFTFAVASHAQDDASLATGKTLASELGCIGCHGEQGMVENEETPNIGGQDWGYLMQQLRSFADLDPRTRDDYPDFARYHFGMERNVKPLTYDERNLLATYFSSFSCVPENVPDPDSVPNEVKKCARCHGLFGVNLKPGIPDLSGQKASYIIKQLRAFRASRLGANPMAQEQPRYHSEMEQQAYPLSDDQIEEIAKYFEALSCS
jgi:cytochrome c553